MVFSTKKTDRHDITEILLKVALNTIKQTNKHTNPFVLSVWLLSYAVRKLVEHHPSFKKCLNIPSVYSEAVNQRMTDNTISKRIIYKTLCINLKIEQHENSTKTHFKS
jgi:hypothetical protein